MITEAVLLKLQREMHGLLCNDSPHCPLERAIFDAPVKRFFCLVVAATIWDSSFSVAGNNSSLVLARAAASMGLLAAINRSPG